MPFPGAENPRKATLPDSVQTSTAASLQGQALSTSKHQKGEADEFRSMDCSLPRDQDDSMAPAQGLKPEGRLHKIKEMYRREGHSVPASVSSSLVVALLTRPLLNSPTATGVIDAMGPYLGAAATFAVFLPVWYLVFSKAALPAFSRLRNRGTSAAPQKTEESGGQMEAAKLSKKYFLWYSIGFTALQFAAQVAMLQAGLAPGTAQAANSLAGNVLWLSTLPPVRALLNNLAVRRVSAKTG